MSLCCLSRMEQNCLCLQRPSARETKEGIQASIPPDGDLLCSSSSQGMSCEGSLSWQSRILSASCFLEYICFLESLATDSEIPPLRMNASSVP